MLFEYQLSAPRENFYNITPQLRKAVAKSGITSGHAVVFARTPLPGSPSTKMPTRMWCGICY